MADQPPDPVAARWLRVTTGIATIVAGMVVFGLGVGYGFGPIEVVGALTVACGFFMLVRALLAFDR